MLPIVFPISIAVIFPHLHHCFSYAAHCIPNFYCRYFPPSSPLFFLCCPLYSQFLLPLFSPIFTIVFPMLPIVFPISIAVIFPHLHHCFSYAAHCIPNFYCRYFPPSSPLFFLCCPLYSQFLLPLFSPIFTIVFPMLPIVFPIFIAVIFPHLHHCFPSDAHCIPNFYCRYFPPSSPLFSLWCPLYSQFLLPLFSPIFTIVFPLMPIVFPIFIAVIFPHLHHCFPSDAHCIPNFYCRYFPPSSPLFSLWCPLYSQFLLPLFSPIFTIVFPLMPIVFPIFIAVVFPHLHHCFPSDAHCISPGILPLTSWPTILGSLPGHADSVEYTKNKYLCTQGHLSPNGTLQSPGSCLQGIWINNNHT